MKQSVRSLLDTLGEDDYVTIANFPGPGELLVGCNRTFIQATHWNKEVAKYPVQMCFTIRELFTYFLFDAQHLKRQLDVLVPHGVADYAAGFEFAFQQFIEFNETIEMTSQRGANCNNVIMFFTDEGTDHAEEVFKQYNSDKRVRYDILLLVHLTLV